MVDLLFLRLHDKKTIAQIVWKAPSGSKMDFSGLIASYRPASAVEEDVFETLHRSGRARRPLRHLADSIIRRRSVDHVEHLICEEDLRRSLDDAIHKGLRLLHYAAYQNDLEVTQLLLELGADPNLMDDVGYTPIHICAEKGYAHLILLLLDYGARLRFTEVNPGDKSYGEPPRATAADEPLRLAIRNGEHEVALLLLQHGANPSACYYLGQEINLVDSVDLRSLQLLLSFGADPNARDMQGLTPLMKACRSSQASEAVELLLSYGADVNALTPEDQRTPLHYAVLVGNLSIVRSLVASGARVCFPLQMTRPPPLYFAVLRGNVEILEFLLDAGADINAVSTVVGSALHLALTEKICNKLQIVRTLLERGADPNAITLSDKGPVLKPPVGEYLQSCEQPQLEIIQLLLRYGARIVLKGQRDHPLGIVKVIHRLHLGLNEDVMTLLLDACESFNVDFVQQSRQMTEEHKELILERALQPLALRHIARSGLRRALGWGPCFIGAVRELPLPHCLKEFVLFQG